MKKYYFLMALAATAIMSACSTENEFTPQTSGEKVSFFVDNGPITRTTVNTADASTKFAEGDGIGIFATGGAIASNVGYKVGAGTEGTLSPIDGKDIEWTTEDAGNFYAYYPYAAGTVTDKVKFTVTDQTTADEFNKNDFMVAKAAVANKADIKFKFAHGLSLVQVVLSGDKAAGATEVTLTAKPTVEWAFATGSFTTSGDATTIKMWKIADDDQTYWAMIPAQTIPAQTIPAEAFVNIKVGSKNYTYTPTEAITLTTAKIKKFNLTLGEAGQAISVSTEMDTEGWGDDGKVDGDTEEEIVPPTPAVELISAAEITSGTTPFVSKGGKQDCVEGWNYIMAEANGTAVIDETEKAFAIKKLASGGASWYNGTIYYCTEAGKATKATYKLTFKVKALEEKDIQVAVMAKESGNRWFVSGTNTVRYEKATTDAYRTVTLDFDLSQITSSNAAAATDSTDDDVNEVLVYFTPKDKSDTNTFYIKDVTFIEVKE